MKPPTEHQRAVLREIQSLTTRWGYPPTVRELCEVFAVNSTNAMQETIGYLIQKNCLRRASKLARSLTLTEKGKTFL
jgi:SOS-response transcriptional repressor LexA